MKFQQIIQKEEPSKNYFEEVYGQIGKGTERVNWFFDCTPEMQAQIAMWPAKQAEREKLEEDEMQLIESFLGRVTNGVIGEPSKYFYGKIGQGFKCEG